MAEQNRDPQDPGRTSDKSERGQGKATQEPRPEQQQRKSDRESQANPNESARTGRVTEVSQEEVTRRDQQRH